MANTTMEILVGMGTSSIKQTAEIMTEEEFLAIENEKETPSYVVVGDKLFYNSYTCWGGYDGTCNCISHPRKEWIESPLKEHSFRGFSALYCPRCKKETGFFIKSNLPRYSAGQCTECNWEDFRKKVEAIK